MGTETLQPLLVVKRKVLPQPLPGVSYGVVVTQKDAFE
jgi:hypothetical protein